MLSIKEIHKEITELVSASSLLLKWRDEPGDILLEDPSSAQLHFRYLVFLLDSFKCAPRSPGGITCTMELNVPYKPVSQTNGKKLLVGCNITAKGKPITQENGLVYYDGKQRGVIDIYANLWTQVSKIKDDIIVIDYKQCPGRGHLLAKPGGIITEQVETYTEHIKDNPDCLCHFVERAFETALINFAGKISLHSLQYDVSCNALSVRFSGLKYY